MHQAGDSLGLVYSPQLLPANEYSLSPYAGCLPYHLEAAPSSGLCFARDSSEGQQLQLQRTPGGCYPCLNLCKGLLRFLHAAILLRNQTMKALSGWKSPPYPGKT